MKRALLIVALLLLAAAGIWGVRSWAAQEGNAGSRPAAATPVAEENVIWASGKLVPARWAGLSPAANGTVRVFHIAEGDRVTAGAVLIELENGALRHQVDVAAASAAEAQAALAKLLAGATPEQVAQAEADVAAAEAAVALSQAALKEAQQAVMAAQAQAKIVQAQYDELASRPNDEEKVVVERELLVAQAAVRQAQSAYDRVKGAPDVATLPESLALEQATVRLDSARAAYNVAARGATPKQLAVAAAQVSAAQSQTHVAESRVPSAEAGVQASKAQLARARAALAALRAGATPEERAIAESRVKSAAAAREAAQAELEQTQVTSPFDGQIGNVLVRPGELAVPGQPLLMLGDTGHLRVETTDLRETDVTRLQLGMPVEVTFDALPGRTFSGRIERIAPMSTAEKGSTNYTVVVEVPDQDPGLRWGMTAFVNIRTE